MSSFGFGGANAHVVLREVLPRDVVEREPEPVEEATSTEEQPVEHVRFDEYGEFIGDNGAPAVEEEPELPGLTEEAKRLKEVALQELAASEQQAPLVPLAVSAF